MKFDMYIPTRILFGAGSLGELHTHSLPGKKALIIISNGKSTRANGYLARTQEQLALSGVESCVFDGIEPNPTVQNVEAGAAAAKANGCDFLVALGGGSVMDASKGIAVMATNPGQLWDYILGGTGKAQPVGVKPLPIVAITTTAGTGSEADAGAVITNLETNEKTVLSNPQLFPVISIVDPELMCSVPPKFTAYQGFDALFHSIEGYISKTANPMSNLFALDAIRRIAQYLPVAVQNGADLQARSEVALANTLSGFVMDLALLTSEHSMEHALSAYHPALPHGAGLIMLSREYHQFFVDKHACDERYIRMAQAMGMPGAGSPQDFITALVRLQAACGVDSLKMSDYGMSIGECATFASNAREAMGFLFAADPCPMSDAECAEIFRKSFDAAPYNGI